MEESLDPEAVVDGMILCSNNASKLADDARIMMIFKRHSTAGLLAITRRSRCAAILKEASLSDEELEELAELEL